MRTTPRHLCFDLQPGDVFTVRSQAYPPGPTYDSFGGANTGLTFGPSHRPSNLFPGLPLRFRALDYPFILCAVINQAGQDTLQTVLDLRCHTIQRLSPAFLDAMTSWSPPNQSPPISETPGCPDQDTDPPTLPPTP